MRSLKTIFYLNAFFTPCTNLHGNLEAIPVDYTFSFFLFQLLKILLSSSMVIMSITGTTENHIPASQAENIFPPSVSNPILC